jgi:GNAT superfamily N-acetyltransferase
MSMWRALDDRLAHVEPQPWGAVVTDARFPLIWDVNYARVETDEPGLRLADVEAALDPALERAGAVHRHLVLFHPEPLSDLVVEASSRGARLTWEVVMGLGGAADGPADPDVDVEEVEPDERFLGVVRDSLAEFDVRDEGAADQLMAIEREVMRPAGKRWFRVVADGREAALGSLVPVGDVGLVDHVVTLPFARRRGYAGAIVRRIVVEARAAGIGTIVLLTDPNGEARRLYERIGFRTLATIASTVERR